MNEPNTGCPGSGKGTLCKMLSQNHGYHHISVGDLLRDMTQTLQSERDYIIAGFVRDGNLLPTEIVLDILKDACGAAFEEHSIVVVDGFPRRFDQAVAADKGVRNDCCSIFSFVFLLTEPKYRAPDLVLFFGCGKEESKRRYLTRKRGQDDEAMFEKRFEEFASQNEAILDHYRKQDKLITVSIPAYSIHPLEDAD